MRDMGEHRRGGGGIAWNQVDTKGVTVSDSATFVSVTGEQEAQKLGYEPELRREFGFFHAFAISFADTSLIVAFYGSFALALGAAGPTFFWGMLAVLILQILVVLVLGEVSSRYPLEGAIYQWTHRTDRGDPGMVLGVGVLVDDGLHHDQLRVCGRQLPAAWPGIRHGRQGLVHRRGHAHRAGWSGDQQHRPGDPQDLREHPPVRRVDGDDRAVRRVLLRLPRAWLQHVVRLVQYRRQQRHQLALDRLLRRDRVPGLDLPGL